MIEAIDYKNYLDEHPDATLKEAYDAIVADDEEKYRLECERREKEKEWNMNLSYKWFLIKFNASSKLVCQLDKIDWVKAFDQSFKILNGYDIYNGSKTTQIQKTDRWVNTLWFNNPYRIEYRDPRCTVKELSTEEVNKYLELFKQYDELNIKLFNLL